jgi:NitT/TauT family transport system substrate-binding protein
MPLKGKILIFVAVCALLGYIYWKARPDNSLTSSSATKTASKASDIEVSDTEPLKVCINTWPGFAPGIWANGGLAASKSSRFYKDYGLLVEFKLVDDFQQSREMWKTDNVDILWCTVDAFASEAEGLKQFEPQVFMKVDNSYGGDVVVATREVATINDAKGKNWAFAPRTPSHSLTIWALQAGDLRESSIHVVPVDLAPVAADMFVKGTVDLATVWSPDDEKCLKLVPGAHVVASTKTASEIIIDAFICKKAKAADPNFQLKLKAFCEGWFRAAGTLNTSPEALAEAAELLTVPFNSDKEGMIAGIKNAKLANYGDNANFFNLSGTFKGMTGEKLYNHMVEEFTKTGYASEATPSWRAISSSSVIRSLTMSGADQKGEEAAAIFTPVTKEIAARPAFANKKITVNFPVGSYALTAAAKSIIDNQFVPYAQGFKYARIKVSGHTDNTGSYETNMKLSEQRAAAINMYLITEYGFDPNRFLPAIGFGPEKPIASNATESGRAQNRRTEFELIQDDR